MAKWTISKFFSIVIFLTLMIFFFFWITNQVSDLGLFFGFRTSHTVANDIANMITSIGGVPGETSSHYGIEPGSSSQPFNYEIRISDKMVCATSYLIEKSKSTTDCATHPYDVGGQILCKTDKEGYMSILIRKTIVSGDAKISIEGCTAIA